MNFNADPPKQLKEIRVIQNPICEIFEIDVTKRDDEQTDDFFGLSDSDLKFLEFEDMVFEDNLYTEEKRKGGENSYQRHKALKDQVQILCREELNKKTYLSALQLCQTVANRIINESPGLLDSFEPYKNYDVEGRDWTKPSFYNWCNSEFKSSQNKLKESIA